MELNAEQIKKALCVCWDTTCSDCEFDNICEGHWQVLENACTLINSQEQKINELTDDVEEWKALAEDYKNRFVDCRNEKAKLTEENERLRVENKVLTNENVELKNKIQEEIAEEDINLFDEFAKLSQEGIREAKADTVREMQERLKAYEHRMCCNFCKHSLRGRRNEKCDNDINCFGWNKWESMIDQIAKEIIEQK